jgi:hypothetical protein
LWFERAVLIELSYLKKRLLYLLGFLYESKQIIMVWEHLQTQNRERIANSLEVIDVLAAKELSSIVLPILEDFPLEQQLKILNAKYHNPRIRLDQFISSIISGVNSPPVLEWTKVAAIMSVRDFKEEHLYKMIGYAETSDTPVLIETAHAILESISKNSNQVNPEVEGLKTKIQSKIQFAMETKLLTIEKVMILKTTEIFKETAEDLLVDISKILKEMTFYEGDQIVKKGDIGTCMFIIYSGRVKVHDGDLIYTEFKNGDFFGELSLLDTEPRSASVTALEDSLLLRIDQTAFYEIMSDRSEVIREIMKILCGRLRKQNQEVSRLNERLNSMGL